jgi:hypothetical protein
VDEVVIFASTFSNKPWEIAILVDILANLRPQTIESAK